MTRLLITGVNGFVGRHLAAAAQAAGHHVSGTLLSGPAPDGVDGHVCDLDDEQGLVGLMEDLRPDAVVHLAALSFVPHADADAIYRTNLIGTRHLLQAAVQAGHRPTVLLVSSATVYGDAAGVVNESAPTDPRNDYAVSKLAMESLAGLYRDRFPIRIARAFNHTGRGQDPKFLVSKMVDHARRRVAVMELGNLDVARDISDVRDVVGSYLSLLDADVVSGACFNVCSGHAVSLRHIADRVAELSGHCPRIEVNPDFVRANEVKSLCGSAERLERAIGRRHLTPLDDTLRWMLA